VSLHISRHFAFRVVADIAAMPALLVAERYCCCFVSAYFMPCHTQRFKRFQVIFAISFD
jgi:hypothetical protein